MRPVRRLLFTLFFALVLLLCLSNITAAPTPKTSSDSAALTKRDPKKGDPGQYAPLPEQVFDDDVEAIDENGGFDDEEEIPEDEGFGDDPATNELGAQAVANAEKFMGEAVVRVYRTDLGVPGRLQGEVMIRKLSWWRRPKVYIYYADLNGKWSSKYVLRAKYFYHVAPRSEFRVFTFKGSEFKHGVSAFKVVYKLGGIGGDTYVDDNGGQFYQVNVQKRRSWRERIFGQ
ncbi:hypothetical protein HK102_005987 [Quaeritorhiza haematococci]|nr:hypothetical protein HK102_005987 [Quaeritorhiza haematococci]